MYITLVRVRGSAGHGSGRVGGAPSARDASHSSLAPLPLNPAPAYSRQTYPQRRSPPYSPRRNLPNSPRRASRAAARRALARSLALSCPRRSRRPRAPVTIVLVRVWSFIMQVWSVHDASLVVHYACLDAHHLIPPPIRIRRCHLVRIRRWQPARI